MRKLIGKGWRIARHPITLLLICTAGILFAVEAENVWSTVPFALSIAAVMAGLLFLATARAAFSIYAGWLIVALFTAISAIKYKMKGFSLHFYDAVFFAGDPETYRFLYQSYLYLLVPVGFALLAAVAIGIAAYRYDRRSNWSFAWRAGLAAVLGASPFLTFPADASKNRFFYYMQGRHLTASFVSLLDIGNLFLPNELERRLAQLPAQQPMRTGVDCGDGKGWPDIFFVLSESVTDPAIFPQVKDTADFMQRFAPDAGKPSPMSVETFGGGTWITNLSLFVGLSATDFGWRSPYLTLTLQDRIGDSLPEILSKCGYRTAALLPLDYTFVNEGPFLKSIGFETVLDIDDIEAPNYHLRDDFYYRAAEKFIAQHRATDGRPLFLEIQTMFPHSPYEDRMEPQLTADGEPFAADPGVAEYLRRIAIARGDFQTFLDRRKAEPTARGSVVFEFGDHQAFVTKRFVDEIAGVDAMSKPNSLAYRTYFTTTAFNYTMPGDFPSAMPLDIGFVGASFLEAAGLPMSPTMRDLIDLRDRCEGRFHACSDRQAVDRHLRARVDAGLLKILPPAEAEPVVASRR
ncbi:MAG: sulfatase-like hydrolase/transferase [Rhizobiaceae bacterium]